MAERKKIELPQEVVPIMKEIGSRVNEFRKEKNSNYKRFAELNEINAMTLWRVQKGEDVKLSSFLMILKKLEVSPKEFFSVFEK